MTFLTSCLLLGFIWLTFGQNDNTFAQDVCKVYNNDQTTCEETEFSIPGYGVASCIYVGLTTLQGGRDEANFTTSEKACVPDHCALFANDSSRCMEDSVCVWENDPTTQRSNISRCFPACFNKVDIMFLIDGTTSQIEEMNRAGTSNFQLNLEAVQEFVRDRIPEKGLYNNIYETREYFVSFGGEVDGAGFFFPSSLTFSDSEPLSPTEASLRVLNLTAPGGGTNLRRALAEAGALFEADTEPDHQRVLLVFSDGAATDHEYLEFSFPELGINEATDNDLRISLGGENCTNMDAPIFRICEPIQYFDLGPAIWDPLDVYYQFFVLGNVITQLNPSFVTSNGPLYAERFVVDPVTDLISILGNNYTIFTQGGTTAARLSRRIDASICSETSNPTYVPSATPTRVPTLSPLPETTNVPTAKPSAPTNRAWKWRWNNWRYNSRSSSSSSSSSSSTSSSSSWSSSSTWFSSNSRTSNNHYSSEKSRGRDSHRDDSTEENEHTRRQRNDRW